ncbi:MAG: phosphate ABC transporter permease PstA [Gammaproteobacteria bacterium AqS3]|nr:phosphate ABC transporter permease PstA [Gammaproteobacteria bacterium AqS3]
MSGADKNALIWSRWRGSREGGVWLIASAISLSLVLVLGMILLLAVRGMGYFWPSEIIAFEYREYREDPWMPVQGEVVGREDVIAAQLISAGYELESDQGTVERWLIKVGNRDVGPSDFLWVLRQHTRALKVPEDVAVIERLEWGNFYGTISELHRGDERIGRAQDGSEALMDALRESIERAEALRIQVREIEKHDIGTINAALNALRLEERGLNLRGEWSPEHAARLERARQVQQQAFEQLSGQIAELREQLMRDSISVVDAEGARHEIELEQIVRVLVPNRMGVFSKLAAYLERIWEFLSDEPREANTEGGIFPALFGTVIMVLLMTIFVTPGGVIAAIYLREYAHQGMLTRIVRIAINNLAGVPSIVYGIFGLGFFVYFVGGEIDEVFYSENLPAPTFGSPGLVWASLTLALLSLPVVVVATEEGLARVPKSMAEGSYALGATQFEMLRTVLMPIISPAIMTGLILAIARAAGEVAPLMLVGAVKLAPSLPVDFTFPFVHLDRQFMHLGFHIYDVGFQSPNVEAAQPLVYATAFLLVLIIIVLNLLAIQIRNNLREQYRSLES